MAKARALDKRRKSIKNIRKITRTMELVATAQFRRAMERAISADAFTKRLVHLVEDIAKTGSAVQHPLLEDHKEPKRVVLLVLTANRGMCGGYNSSLLRLAMQRMSELQNEYENLILHVSGKRGIAYMKYRGAKVEESYDYFDVKPTFEEVDVLAEKFLSMYLKGEIDRLEVVYSKFFTMSRQKAVVETFLPMTELRSEDTTEEKKEGVKEFLVPYEFLPSPQSILEEVVPTAFKSKLFKCFLDAAVSEQIARMVAMKAATENADTMINSLTTTYNRARQSQITNEIIEVISGASALQ